MPPIGVMRTDYDEKFGAPRQSGVVVEARGSLLLPKNEANREALHGLDGFTHVWVIFLFDQVCGRTWSPRVRPPRLGGDASMGVFATRSPFRPNPIGLSVLKYEGLEESKDELKLNFSGVDLVDGTPVLDIKPYLPYADSLPDAKVPPVFEKKWPSLKVIFEEEAKEQLAEIQRDEPGILALIESTLSQDPRPAVQREAAREHGLSIRGYNIRFKIVGSECRVISVEN